MTKKTNNNLKEFVNMVLLTTLAIAVVFHLKGTLKNEKPDNKKQNVIQNNLHKTDSIKTIDFVQNQKTR